MTDETTTSVNHHKSFLIILDGWGMTQHSEASAITHAQTPVMDRLLRTHPHAFGSASGPDVGLPEGQFGNSEVGHLNIGAGRIVWQELSRIDQSITDGDFKENPAIGEALKSAKTTGRLHIFGLVSDGGVHAHIHHLKAMLALAHEHDIQNVYIHAFTDGRDTSPSSGAGFIEDIQAFIADKPNIKLASLIGRYYAMDRDKRWDRTERAYRALVHGEGDIVARDALQSALHKRYAEGETDEFLSPILVEDYKIEDREIEERDIGDPEAGITQSRIQSGDPLVCINFRGDRARQLLKAFLAFDEVDFEQERPQKHKGTISTFTAYDETFSPFVHVAYPPQRLDNTLGKVIEHYGLKQLRAAETEKYAHVTYFLNGGIEEPNQGEDRVLIPSPKIATYDLQPDMSAIELTDTLVPKIESSEFDLIVLNYANPDMVGHTGNFDAAVKAIETVDTQLGRCLNAASEGQYRTLIIADHGNADVMVKPDGTPHTAHTTAKVPIILVEPDGMTTSVGTEEMNTTKNSTKTGGRTLQDGKLADIAPTLLDLMGLSKPAEMTGRSLLE
ncbi:MAG: 2,3-bisphosphoglycerate-independent phosphoglycerate mutase [Balneolaceae bacterium]|nr:2,3-bisphosphoglycerate-independent phosphoglycerate mutase [Balneolaceae bacterium]